MTFGDRLRECREAKRLTQSYMASYLKTTDKRYSNLERGYSNSTDPQEISKLCRLFNVSADYLIDGHEFAPFDSFNILLRRNFYSLKEKLRNLLPADGQMEFLALSVLETCSDFLAKGNNQSDIYNRLSLSSEAYELAQRFDLLDADARKIIFYSLIMEERARARRTLPVHEINPEEPLT